MRDRPRAGGRPLRDMLFVPDPPARPWGASGDHPHHPRRGLRLDRRLHRRGLGGRDPRLARRAPDLCSVPAFRDLPGQPRRRPASAARRAARGSRPAGSLGGGPRRPAQSRLLGADRHIRPDDGRAHDVGQLRAAGPDGSRRPARARGRRGFGGGADAGGGAAWHDAWRGADTVGRRRAGDHPRHGAGEPVAPAGIGAGLAFRALCRLSGRVDRHLLDPQAGAHGRGAGAREFRRDQRRARRGAARRVGRRALPRGAADRPWRGDAFPVGDAGHGARRLRRGALASRARNLRPALPRLIAILRSLPSAAKLRH